MQELNFEKAGFNVRGFVAIEANAILPTRATKHSAGYDVHALNDYVLYPNDQIKIETGVSAYMPHNEYLMIVPRSGLCNRFGVTVANSPAIIDSDFYPRPFCVLLINHGKEPFAIRQGERIAQAIFHSYNTTDNDNADIERAGGFGHTGT